MALIKNFLQSNPNIKYKNINNKQVFFVRNTLSVNLPSNLTNNLSYFIGLIQGDGWIKSKQPVIGLTSNNIDIINNFKFLTKELFNYKVKEYIKKNKKSRVLDLLINSYVISKFLITNFDLKSGYKKDNLDIPKIILKNKLFFSWLAGFVDTDGHIAKERHLIIVQSSKKILENIMGKLLEYNINGRIIFNKCNNSYYLKFKQKETYSIFNLISPFMKNKIHIKKLVGPAGIEPAIFSV